MAQKKPKPRINSLLTLRPLLAVAMITVIALNILFTILPIREKYVRTDYWSRYPALKKTFNDSIYVNKKGSFIPDEIIYSYAGGSYIQGTSPILINPEVPPLGKYLIGLSILLFGNENIIILFSGITSLFLLFLLGKQFLSSNLAALISPLFLSFEPLFKNQFVRTPLLDIIQLMFMLSAFYFFIKAVNAKKYMFLYFAAASLLLGFFISTKFFGIGAAIVISWYVSILLYRNKKHFVYLTLTLPIAILTLLLSYSRVFFTNYPLSQFLGIQKWIFLYNKGHLQNAFTVWPLLMMNRWHTWWGTREILSDAQWNILWPTIVIISFATIILYIFKKIPHKKGLESIMLWIILYLSLLSLSDATVRYFVILLPMLYLVATYGVEKIVINYFKKPNKS